MPKSYSQFKYEDIFKLGLELHFKTLFPQVKNVQPSDFLIQTLKEKYQTFPYNRKGKV